MRLQEKKLVRVRIESRFFRAVKYRENNCRAKGAMGNKVRSQKSDCRSESPKVRDVAGLASALWPQPVRRSLLAGGAVL